MNNKGTEMWWIIVTGIIAIIAVILIVLFFRGSLTSSREVVDNTYQGFGDKDCDKTTDFLDACPCDKDIQTREQLDQKSNENCDVSCTEFVVQPCS